MGRRVGDRKAEEEPIVVSMGDDDNAARRPSGGRAAGWMSYGTCHGRQPMDTAGNRPTFGDDSLRDGPVLPDIVIAPAHPAPHEPAEIVFEVRPGAEGIDVLPVFSSVGQLVAT